MIPVISVRTRKRLWTRAGNQCAFPGCCQRLLEPIEGTDEDTIVGIECHIIPREDSPAVSRSESSLSDAEKEQYQLLIQDRHCYSNLVLMCAVHSAVIDDANNTEYTVERVIEIKRLREEEIESTKSSQARREDELLLRNAAIVDGWEARVSLSTWQGWLGPVFGDGHPRIRVDYFDRLTEARAWMFSRVWPGNEPLLQEAFENFRFVAQDLQLALQAYDNGRSDDTGWIEPIRFYNEPGWMAAGNEFSPHQMYEWLTFLLEDLALELTRAANLFCEAVRRTIDPRYRLEEGLVVLESGPYADLLTRLHRPQYVPEDGWSPYSGLRAFLQVRTRRDEFRGEGDPPAGIRVPGESPFA